MKTFMLIFASVLAIITTIYFSELLNEQQLSTSTEGVTTLHTIYADYGSKHNYITAKGIEGTVNPIEIRRNLPCGGSSTDECTLILHLSQPSQSSSENDLGKQEGGDGRSLADANPDTGSEIGTNTTATSIAQEKDVTSVVAALRRHTIHINIGTDDDDSTTTDDVSASASSCPYPTFGIRLVGPALVGIQMVEIEKSSLWSGTFDIPVEGTYTVELRWYACNGAPEMSMSPMDYTTLSIPITFDAVRTSSDATVPENRTDGNDELFPPDSYWLNTTHFAGRIRGSGLEKKEFAWLNLHVHTDKNMYVDASTTARVSTESTFRHPNDYYSYGNLQNYEIVCFVGGKSMEDIRSAFVKLSSKIRPGQRAFKFHMKKINRFVHPTREWGPDSKALMRKCKHVLIAIDEPEEPVSQDVYVDQVKTFLGHWVRLVNDMTFPIWIYSVNESPLNATNCHTPTRKRTLDHPCNDALKEMFRSGNEINNFPSQVHFLDNTDLTLPQMGENYDDIVAHIALRTFVVIGKGVKDWRDMNQIGKIDGLHRNGTLEPTFELVPYDDWDR